MTRTEEIINRFKESWTEVEKRLDELISFSDDPKRLQRVRNFISELRDQGEDQFFRLGTSMDRIIFSRSVNNGLRLDQKYIFIETYDNKFNVILRDGQKVYREYWVESLNDIRVKKLLKTLKDTLVD